MSDDIEKLIDTKNSLDLDLNVLYAKYSEKDDDWHSTTHMHPFTELFYVVKGKGQFIAEDKTFTLKEDDLLVVNSKIRHTEVSLENEEFAYIVIGIEGVSIIYDYLKGTEQGEINFDEYIESYVFKYNFSNDKKSFRYYITRILEEMTEKKFRYKDFSDSYLKLLIMTISRRLQDNLVISGDVRENKQLEFIKMYIDKHYSREISLDSLANMTYINKFYLVHEFKKLYNMTPIDYLLYRRIETAKELLRTTDYSMEEVSYIVGFNSQSYFNQVFKKKMKVTPSKYKKQYSKNFD